MNSPSRRLACSATVQSQLGLRKKAGGDPTETNSEFLTLEHVNGDGKAHRMKIGSHTYADLRRRGSPQEGYTLLCWNCNAMTRGGRTCPHMEETE